MKVDKIKNIAHIYVIERYKQRVFIALRRSPINRKFLIVMAYREAVHLQMVLAVHYSRRSYMPRCVANSGTRRQNVDISSRHAIGVLGEYCTGIYNPLKRVTFVVAETERRIQMVV